MNFIDQLNYDINTKNLRSNQDDTLILISDLLSKLNVSYDNAILDLGCSSGHYHDYDLLNQYTFVGIDTESKFRNNKNVYFTKNLEEYPYDDILSDKFDYILCLEVLQHLYRPDVFLLNTYQNLLNTDGFVFLTVPNINTIDDQLSGTNIAVFNPKLKYPTNNRWTAQHIRHFDYESLKELCEQIGFTVYLTTGCNFYTSTIGQHIIHSFGEKFNIPYEKIIRELGNTMPTLAPNLFFVLKKES